MEPRINTTQKWTPLPGDYVKNILCLLEDHYKAEAKLGQFVAEGRIYRNELLFMSGYLAKGRLRQINFYVSVAMDSKKDKALELIQMAVNIGAQLLGSYFESEALAEKRPKKAKADQEEGDWPHEWTIVEDSPELKKHKVYVRYDTTNSGLEDAANKLLGENASEDLIQGDEDDANDEVVEAIKASLGLGDDASELDLTDSKNKKKH